VKPKQQCQILIFALEKFVPSLISHVFNWQNSQNGPQTFYRRSSSSSNFQKGQYGPWTHVFGPNVSLCWCGTVKCHEMNVKCPFCPWYLELLVLLIFACAFLTCFMFLFVCLQYSLRIQSMQPASCAFGWASIRLIFFYKFLLIMKKQSPAQLSQIIASHCLTKTIEVEHIQKALCLIL